MKMTAFISRVTEQYIASEALVLPVDAQAARLAPVARAWVNAALMPLSLKLPEGFIPSYCKCSGPFFMPWYLPTTSGLQVKPHAGLMHRWEGWGLSGKAIIRCRVDGLGKKGERLSVVRKGGNGQGGC